MDIEGARAKAEELMSSFEQMCSSLGDTQRRLKAVTATVASPDGNVKATVGPRGQLVKLELDPRIYRRQDSKALATTITETIQRATRKAADDVEQILRPHMPDAQLQAHLDLDLEGLLRQFDSDLPTGDH